MEMHRDAVLAIPAGAISLGATDTCPVQAFLLPGRAVAVQGHPEFTSAIVREILDARYKLGLFTDDFYSSGVTRAEHKHDGEDIARAFIRFLREP